MEHPPGMALSLGSIVNERIGAVTYVRQWGPEWKATTEAIDFVCWLHTHPRVIAERAAILAPLEELMREHDISRRGPLIEANRWHKDAIDDALSREIGEPRDDGRNPPDRPWRLAKLRQQWWERASRGGSPTNASVQPQ